MRILELLEELPSFELNTLHADNLDEVIAGGAVCDKSKLNEQQNMRKKIFIEIWRLALKRKLKKEGEKLSNWESWKLQNWTGWVLQNDKLFKEQMQLAFPGWDPDYPEWDSADRNNKLITRCELMVTLMNE